jgi:hypothetical protein
MPGFFEALRAKIAPPATSSEQPLMEELLKRVRGEMPDVADASIEPMGWLGRKLSGGAIAVTTPFGGVKYDPDALKGASPDEIADTLAHELTHVRQVRQLSPLQRVLEVGRGFQFGIGGGLPYGQRPEELEAYQAEADRATAQGRTPAPAPSFTKPGEFRMLGDVRLYP